MNRTKFTLMAGMLLAAAFVFSCGDDESGYEPPAIDSTCGGSLLPSAEFFCYAEEIFKKCGVNIYNPLDSFCNYNENVVYERCGGMMLESNDFCYNNRVYQKCNGVNFNPLDSFCGSSGVSAYSRCNGIPYDETVSFCDTNAIPNKIYDKCGSDNGIYNPLDSFCYYYDDGSKILGEKCGNRTFDPLSSFCFLNDVYERCGIENNGVYNPLDSFCYEEKVYERCGGKEYNMKELFCRGDTIRVKCDGKEFNPATEFCNLSIVEKYKQCGSTNYDGNINFCFDNKIYEKCHNADYKPNDSFCYENQLYPKCIDIEDGQNKDYDPNLKGCFEGTIFNICSANGALGICVHNTLLRCKQPGSGEKYIVKPHPGMECKDEEGNKGKIVGSITHNGESYNTVQIGEQVWMAENLRMQSSVEITVDIYEYKYKYFKVDIVDIEQDVITYTVDMYEKDENGHYIIDYDVDVDDIDNPPENKWYENVREHLFETPIFLGVIVDDTIPPEDKNWRYKNVLPEGEGDLVLLENDVVVISTSPPKGKVYKNIRPKTIYGNELSKWSTVCNNCPPDRNDNDGNVSYVQRRGLCPEGWRIPSSNDWKELIDYAGGASVAGNRLKSANESDWSSSGYGVDSYGFNAKPVIIQPVTSPPKWFESNIVSALSSLDAIGAIWWTSTSLSAPNTVMAKFWYIISSDTEAKELAYEKELFGFSVRCLQNIE